MKTKIRPGHSTMLQMNDWLAELRDGESADPIRPGNTEPPGPGYAVPASYSYGLRTSSGHAEPARYARAMAAGPGYAVPAAMAVPSQPTAVPGRKPSPGPLPQPRPPPQRGPLPPLSQPGLPPWPRPLARPGLPCGL